MVGGLQGFGAAQGAVFVARGRPGVGRGKGGAMKRQIAEAGSDGPERNEAFNNLGAAVADFVTLIFGIASPNAT